MNTQRYYTDLTDDEGAVLEPHLPQPLPRAGPASIPSARSSTPSSFSYAVAVPGGCCPAICPSGRPSIITSGYGGSRGCGHGLMRRYINAWGCRWGASRIRVCATVASPSPSTLSTLQPEKGKSLSTYESQAYFKT